MHRGHHTAGGIKWNFIDPAPLLFQVFFSETRLHAKIQQCRFRGIADGSAIGVHGIVTQHKALKKSMMPVRIHALRHVRGAAGIALYHSHLVLRQGSCLVRTHDAHGSKCFHGRKPADNSVYFDHSGNTQSKHDGDNCRQAFRDGGDRQ